ncbi:MAG: choice-of-anchor D domain-containing protein [Myxococcota bacterium]
MNFRRSRRGDTCVRLDLVLLALLLAAACSERSGGGFVASEPKSLVVNPPAHVFETVRLGQPSSTTCIVVNASPQADTSVEIVGLRLEASDDFAVSCDRGEAFTLGGGQRAVCEVTFTPTTVQAQTGRLVVDSISDTPSVVFSFQTPRLEPRIEAAPPVLTLSAPDGQTHTDQVQIRNVGSAPLTITDVALVSGIEVFSAQVVSPTSVSEAGIVLEPYGTHGDGEGDDDDVLVVEVTYAPQVTGSDEGLLVVTSNDPEHPTLGIDLDGSSASPCILATEGTDLDFGDGFIGTAQARTVTLLNCGTATLIITQVEPGEQTAMLDDTGAEGVFLIDLGEGVAASSDGALETPIQVEPGDTFNFVVLYAPLDEGLHRGSFRIHSNATQTPLPMETFGRAIRAECPVAIASATLIGESNPPAQEIQARPLDTVVLDGLASWSAQGRVVEWQWSLVEHPDGARPIILPTEPGQAELFLALPGRYQIELRILDEQGQLSCEPSTITVLVVPKRLRYTQLVWNNPDDPNQSDLQGSDVDLHFVKMGSGRWSEAPYDTFYQNTSPDWGPEQPSLDRDDTNGAGPEQITLDDPLACTWYAIGVHHYRAQFGTAYATVRVYLNGLPVFEYLNKPLQRTGDWWDVARLHWPTGTILTVDDLSIDLQGRLPTVTPEMIDKRP